MGTKQRLRQIRRMLGNRDLIYVGPRGVDATPLGRLELSAIFSLIAPAGGCLSEYCLELISGTRVDLNSYSLDKDSSDAAEIFRESMYSSFSRPNAVVSYSSSQTISVGCLSARDTTLALGLHYVQQSCFDYKPWVETALGAHGVQTIPWTYVRTLSCSDIISPLEKGEPIVIRSTHSRGGAGIWLIRNRSDLEHIEESLFRDGLFCVAPFFRSAISVNVNACAFSDGKVSVHGTSLQLVGIEACTPRPLGYSGNDFSSVKELSEKALRGLDEMARSLGSWLVRHGYLGAFGFDALIVEDRVLFVEVNPRFQASSAVASHLDNLLDRPDQYLNHIAAFMGLPAEGELGLPDLVKEQADLSHIVIYNGSGNSVSLSHTPELPGADVRLIPNRSITVDPLGILATILWPGRVTETGHELHETAKLAVLDVLNNFDAAKDQQK